MADGLNVTSAHAAGPAALPMRVHVLSGCQAGRVSTVAPAEPVDDAEQAGAAEVAVAAPGVRPGRWGGRPRWPGSGHQRRVGRLRGGDWGGPSSGVLLLANPLHHHGASRFRARSGGTEPARLSSDGGCPAARRAVHSVAAVVAPLVVTVLLRWRM